MEEANAIESLQLTNYKEANLEEVAANCQNLYMEQQKELLLVFKTNEPLFKGKHKESKEFPVTII